MHNDKIESNFFKQYFGLSGTFMSLFALSLHITMDKRQPDLSGGLLSRTFKDVKFHFS
jgi:hypothetical protein